MKTDSIMLEQNRQVFISAAENKEEDKQLEVLIRETNYICSICVKTGLYIIADFIIQERRIAVMSLRKPLILSDSELDTIKQNVSKL